MIKEQEFLNAARTGDQKTFLNILNDQSINNNPNYATELGNKALVLAAAYGHSDIINKFLTNTCINFSHADQAKKAIMKASMHLHENILRLLLRYSDQRPNPYELAAHSPEAHDL
jgi:ankyrin repeat protein